MGRIITDKLISSLNKICPNRVKTNQYLSDISSWRIGGVADCIVEPSNIEELQAISQLTKEEQIPIVVFGAATNILFDDQGLRALGVRIGNSMSRVTIKKNTVFAEAGLWVPLFARKVGKAGLSGVEHAIGIPGTLGGLVSMNGGSNRKSIGENVRNVKCVNSEGSILEYSHEQCVFSYRTSVFQKPNLNNIIVEVQFIFQREEDPRLIRQELLRILQERRKKFPRKLPTCGSVFLSDPEMYQKLGSPGYIIEKCGLKGYRIGDAEISRKHANFIVNKGKATSENVLELIKIIRKVVLNKTGFLLNPEVRIIDQYGEIRNLQDL